MCGSVADSGMKCDSDGEMVGEMSWLSCFQLSYFFKDAGSPVCAAMA